LDNGLVIEVGPGRFQDMAVPALDGLPEELGQLMRNVAVTVEHRPGPPGLLGLYEGIPLTSQSRGVLPDRITIYRPAICAICRTEQEVDDQVRRTVIHEIAHHFGIDDNRLSELGWQDPDTVRPNARIYRPHGSSATGRARDLGHAHLVSRQPGSLPAEDAG
jgi:predicted Zn-dependent protease with MMP-like domain